ncbi:MAG TPA: hypothetical protein VFZ53_23125 [Polyangiaceae bacterium]
MSNQRTTGLGRRLGGLLFAAIALVSGGAQAQSSSRQCVASSDRDCWNVLWGQGTNVQVAPGLACFLGINQTFLNQHVMCIRAGAGSGIGTGMGPGLRAGDPFDATRPIQSFTLGESSGAGQLVLFALRNDGVTFVSTADSGNFTGFTPWTAIMKPRTTSGSNITLRTITVLSKSFFGIRLYELYGLATDGRLYVRSSADPSRWELAADTRSFRLAYGDLGSGLAVLNTSPARTLAIWGITSPPNIPLVPTSEVLALAPNFTIQGFPNQPFSLDTDDAWMLTNAVSNGFTRLWRSTRSNGVWSNWVETGGTLWHPNGANQWSIVDARRLRGMRGNYLTVGGSFRVSEYVPP